MSNQPKSRKEAQAQGVKKYFNENPCAQGHLLGRYTINGSCVECCRLKSTSSKKKKYDKLRYIQNPEDKKISALNWYKQNKSEVVKKSSEWVAKNPERAKEIKRNYKHRRRSKEKSGVTGRDLISWTKQQAKVCYWCGVDCTQGYHLDHYYPLSKTGTHELNNLVISCSKCNQSKAAKDPIQYANSKGKLF